MVRYKRRGDSGTNEYGTPDMAEFLNISKDDILSYPKATHRTYPSAVNRHMSNSIKPFLETCIQVVRDLYDVLGDRLGLPVGYLGSLHSLKDHSGSETRLTKNPPVGEEGMTEERIALGAHVDVASLVTEEHLLLQYIT